MRESRRHGEDAASKPNVPNSSVVRVEIGVERVGDDDLCAAIWPMFSNSISNGIVPDWMKPAVPTLAGPSLSFGSNSFRIGNFCAPATRATRS
jgi:hypothetical protein